MSTLFISLLTLVLILVSAFIVLIILMQRTSQSGGMGASLGGGAAESAFGSDTNNVLTRGTIYGIVLFFVVAMALYLMYQAQAADSSEQLAVPGLSDLQLDPVATDDAVEAVVAGEAVEPETTQPAQPLTTDSTN
jgi:preprotein translocase subunit SecG